VSVCVCEVYEEQLLSEGLITDNMSQRVVTSLPKCLSDSTMRGSRESLRSSRDSLPGSSTDSLQRDSDDSLHHVSSLGSTGRSASTTALTDSQVSTDRHVVKFITELFGDSDVKRGQNLETETEA